MAAHGGSAMMSGMAKRPAYPNHVGTIGEKIRVGHGLWLHCENWECLHRARIDLEAIAERCGAELSVAEFVNRSCSECGARWPNISISLEPGGTSGAKMGYTVVALSLKDHCSRDGVFCGVLSQFINHHHSSPADSAVVAQVRLLGPRIWAHIDLPGHSPLWSFRDR
jgi:hypothetical protein